MNQADTARVRRVPYTARNRRYGEGKSMLAGMEEAPGLREQPSGGTVTCSSRNRLSFAKIRAGSNNVDVRAVAGHSTGDA